MNRGLLIGLGVASFLLSAVLLMPAARLHARFADAAAPTLYGLEGTLLSGRASGGVVINGRPLLHELAWQFSPWQLPLLRAVLQLDGRGSDAEVKAIVSAGVGGNFHARDVDSRFSLRTLAALAGQSYVPIDGETQIVLEHLSLPVDTAPQAKGRVELRNLRWTLAQSPLLLGDYEAQLAGDDETLTVTLANVSGPLDLKGTITIDAARAYQLDVQLRPKAQADPTLTSLVRSIGPADAQAWHRLKRSGQL